MLLEPLGHSAQWVEPVWLRLDTHVYASSDAIHLTRHYRNIADAGTLDGVILTGAPVEELAYEQVRYFNELRALLERSGLPPTLGLCWGGMVLAHLLGIDKVNFERKLFGVYRLESRESLAGECAQSRHAGLDDVQVEHAAARGALRVLASSTRTGHSILESTNERLLIHLGHPEYTPARLRFEYLRDRKLGRTDVEKPYAVDSDAASSPLPHGYAFFSRWLRQIARVSAQPDRSVAPQRP
jgi:homoserine O-succinyltransferase/O-acetyltransferase